MDLSLYLVRKIVNLILGMRSKMSWYFALHGLLYPLPSMVTHLPCLLESPAFLQVPHFLRPVGPSTKVSTYLLYRIALWKIFFRLLAHSLSYISWLSVCFLIPAPCSGLFAVNDYAYFLICPATAISNSQFSPNRLNTTVTGSIQHFLLLFCPFMQPVPEFLRISPIIFNRS